MKPHVWAVHQLPSVLEQVDLMLPHLIDEDAFDIRMFGVKFVGERILSRAMPDSYEETISSLGVAMGIASVVAFNLATVAIVIWGPTPQVKAAALLGLAPGPSDSGAFLLGYAVGDYLDG